MELEKNGSAEEFLWQSSLSNRDRSLAHFLVFGVLRERGRLDEVLNRNSKKTMDKQKVAVAYILRLAVYELKFSRNPVHAILDQAVELTKFFGFRFASGFVNALLRKSIKEELSSSYRNNLPQFIRHRIESLLEPEKQAQFHKTLATPPEIFIATRDGAPPSLAHEVIDEYNFEFPMYRVKETGNPQSWPGYKEGEWWVMSLSSAMVVEQIVRTIPQAERANTRILDACAAPGAKSLRLKSYGFNVFATDISKNRLRLFKENCDRVGFTIPFMTVDWLRPTTKFKKPFSTPWDVVLIDAPCSGLGVMRRHPEIRWRRTPKDIQAHVVLQKQLVTNVSSHVRDGGSLVYSVCSFFEEEGRAGFEVDNLSLSASWATPLQACADLFQHHHFIKEPLL